MKPAIDTLSLLPKLHTQLMDLLGSLTAQEWHAPTLCAGWNVKDIAAHKLDTNMRRVAMGRDSYFAPEAPALDDYQSLVTYLNTLNADWVKAMRRVSPVQLMEMIDRSGQEMYKVLKQLDPYAKALFPVAWAGEEESQNWFDIAREYTEKWLHQQQIRFALGKPDLLTPEYYPPLLDTFMRALPHHYRRVAAPTGTVLAVHIIGTVSGTWHLHKQPSGWELLSGPESQTENTVSIPGSLAWRLFSKGFSRQEAEKEITFTGDRSLGTPILDMLSVMA